MKKKINFKKILSTIGLLTVVVPATLSVVACGTNKVIVVKIVLSTVIRNREVEGNEFNTEVAVLNQVVALNVSVTLDDVEIKSGSFVAASEGRDGSAVIVAKSGSKYTGEVDVVVTAKNRIALSSVISNRTVDGNEFNTASTVLSRIIVLSGVLTLNDVEIKLDSFIAALPGRDGSVVIVAKSGSKYTDSVEVIISAKRVQKQLSSVLRVHTIATIFDADKAIAAVLAVNPNSGVKAIDLKAEYFRAPDENISGSVTITVVNPNSEYTGSVEVTIKKENNEELNKIIDRIRANPETAYS